MNSFHNTIDLFDGPLIDAMTKAVTQEDVILSFFKAYPDCDFTPPEVLKACFNDNTPITSVRRSMTNLTNIRHLEKTDIQRIGLYGTPNYTWRLKIEKGQLCLL